MGRKTRLNLAITRYLNERDLIPDAQATSTSGRWRIILAVHYREGLPCFDVLAFRVSDNKVTRWEWWAKGESDEEGSLTYDASIAHATKSARDFYEMLVAKMQERSTSEESSEPKGLTLYRPDGTEEEFTIN